ncbi:MAG TPA: HAMP domain-containing sensor histidine kinase [Lachnospiraceae bacterium]|nr:HAMP domain-containing sensor histidine kinase [Lachnospiraceae bacterium]
MKSIRVKLWVGMMILVGAIMVLLWLFQIVFLNQFYSVLEIGELQKDAREIVNEIENLKDIGQIRSADGLLDELEDFVYKNQISIEVIDREYNVIYQGTSGNKMSFPGVMQDSFLETAKKALSGEESKKEVTHPKFGYQFMMIGIPIYDNHSVEGAVAIIMPMAAIAETVHILESQLVIITCILLIISLLISYKLSKTLSDPILRISRQAESYAAGEYEVRIPAVQDDELGKLAKRMNDMGESLARNEKLQKELIANVSHELRTPLTLIRGYAETLRDVTGENPQKREKQLGIIIEESERLGNIVEDILNLSQLQAGAVMIEKEPFSLKEMLEVIKEHYELGTYGRELVFVGVMELRENLIGDKNKLQQVFHNLIGNAFRHSENNQQVEVAVIPTGNTVRIEVRDKGEGIAKEDIDHVFERYYKGKRKDGKKSSGTGLGLAIVKNILEMHQAAYGVESVLGEGSTFWFELDKEHSHTSF